MNIHSYVDICILFFKELKANVYKEESISFHYEINTNALHTMKDLYEIERCDETCVHKDLLKKVNDDMPDEDMLYDLAELFKVFGDSTRIRILYVLFEAEVCVCDIAECLNMTQSAISHQLKILKQSKLIKARREGKQVFYSLADDHVRTIIGMGLEHVEE